MALLLRPAGERETLSDQLADLGRTRKRVAVAAGVFTFVAVVVGCATLAGFLDAVFHLPPLARAIALVILLAAAGVVWVRGISRSLALRTDALSIALELENRFHTFNDSLASAVSFLGTGEEENSGPPGTSNRLQASVVRVAERKADRLPLYHLVPSARCWRAAWVCLAVLAVALPVILWNTSRAGTAFVRLTDPFGAHPWPTKTQIEILSPEEFPTRIAKGDPFELKFAVRGVLSGPATVHLRVNGNESEDPFPLALNNDPALPGAAVVTARFDSARVSSSFSVRVTSNDADTGWQLVTVVPPPRLIPLDGRPSPQFHITPPAYTGLAPDDLPDGAAVIEIPTGTVVRFRAATDVRLSAAVLTYTGDTTDTKTAPFAHLGHVNPIAALGQQQLADAFGSDITLSISGEGTRISGAFIPARSGMYALRLTDETGITGTRLLEIRLISDPAPIVVLTSPRMGSDPPMLTPAASVTLTATADDQKLYGVRGVFLEYRVGRDGQLRTLPMANVPRISPRVLASVLGGMSFATLRHTEPIPVERRIPVPTFRRDDGTPVREGDLLILRMAADDWDDVSVLKAPGRSAEVEIRIASPETIEAWIQGELSQLRTDLLEVRKQQGEAKQKTADVILPPGRALDQADRERLLGAEQQQQQLRAKVMQTPDGLRAKADLLLATVVANNLPKSNTTHRVEIVADRLGRMVKRDLGTIEQNLADARQLASQQPHPGQEQLLAENLRKTLRHQKDVEDTATELIDLLSQWDGGGRIRGDALALMDSILRQLAANEQLKDRVPPGTVKPSDDEQRELDRAGVRAEQASEQAGQLIARAARFASEKDTQAVELRVQAGFKEIQAAALRAEAASATNPVAKSELIAKADAAAADAVALRTIADKAEAEARALRAAIDAAGGQELPDELRKAADALRNNQQAKAKGSLLNAIDRLDRLANVLKEKEADTAPSLTNRQKLKNTADQLHALAGQQDDLRKRVEDVMRITDPEKRQAALRELGKEQDKLIERGRELLQKLTREKFDDAAKDVRGALDRMEIARDDLDKGQPGTRPQMEAVDRLDIARDRLDIAAAQGGRQLSDEKRRKLADQVKALLERQRAAVTEATRIHGLVAKQKGWDRTLLTSYSDLTDREKNIAIEVRKLTQNEFASLPVLARLLTDAASGMESAGDKVKWRCDDSDLAAAFDPELEASNDRKVMRPMSLALLRLEQLHDALKPDDPKSPDKKGGNANAQNPPKNGNPPQPNPNGGGEQDIIPPLAQLKVLRSLQAELNERTAKFAKDHPDPTKLTDDEKEELKELEQAQREISELFEKMAKLFEKKELPLPDEKKLDDKKEEKEEKKDK